MKMTAFLLMPGVRNWGATGFPKGFGSVKLSLSKLFDKYYPTKHPVCDWYVSNTYHPLFLVQIIINYSQRFRMNMLQYGME